MPPVTRVLRESWTRLVALPVIRQDALLYLISSLFALLIFAFNKGDYESWGAIACGVYLAGALASEGWYRWHRPSTTGGKSDQTARRLILVGVFAGAVLAPLGALLVWRADNLPGAHAQVEVRVIEAAGDRLYSGHDPYLAHPTEVGVNPISYDKSVDAGSYFTYLPAMVPFGLSNNLPGPPELGDARFPLLLFSVAVVLFAVAGPASAFGRRGRVLQVLLVLPTGALPLVSGGDDLPVLALMLLALVLAQRRKPVASGLAIGLAAAMKLTAWPLMVVLALGQRDERDRAAIAPYALAAACVVVPVLLVGIVPDPGAFVLNVVKFPLGLAKVNSPAASPLLGEVLTALFPHARRAITIALILVGAAIVGAVLVRRPPRTPAAAANLTAFALALGTVLSPATRFGYLIYPINLVVWSSMIQSTRAGGAGAGAGAGQESAPVGGLVDLQLDGASGR